MIKIMRALKKTQIERGVIFSSTLSKKRTEQPKDNVHEVFKGDPQANQKIERLKNDSFFDGSPWPFNIIREGGEIK